MLKNHCVDSVLRIFLGEKYIFAIYEIPSLLAGHLPKMYLTFWAGKTVENVRVTYILWETHTISTFRNVTYGFHMVRLHEHRSRSLGIRINKRQKSDVNPPKTHNVWKLRKRNCHCPAHRGERSWRVGQWFGMFGEGSHVGFVWSVYLGVPKIQCTINSRIILDFSGKWLRRNPISVKSPEIPMFVHVAAQ